MYGTACSLRGSSVCSTAKNHTANMLQCNCACAVSHVLQYNLQVFHVRLTQALPVESKTEAQNTEQKVCLYDTYAHHAFRIVSRLNKDELDGTDSREWGDAWWHSSTAATNK